MTRELLCHGCDCPKLRYVDAKCCPDCLHRDGHHIDLELRAGYMTAKFSCHEPVGALCRIACTRGCEDITDYCRAEHKWGNVDYCNLVAWLEESGTWEEMYDGPKTPARSGQIVTKWNGDAYTWSYE